MDRIDIQKEVHPVDFFAIADRKSGASSEELRTKVEKARKIQQERYVQEKGINWKLSGSDPIKNGNLFESRKGFFFWTGHVYSPKSVVDAMLKELIYTQERIL